MISSPAILFVCLGNICRSPLAEAAFRAAAGEAGLAVRTDSVGTAAYHVGEPPDPRSIRTAAKHGIDIRHYRGRRLAKRDFEDFTHILAMDHSNLRNIRSRAPVQSPVEISLLLDLLPHRAGEAVADPYYGGENGFETTWREVSEAALALVERLRT